MRPLTVSKINTAAQIALAALALAELGFERQIMWLVELVIYVVAATVLVSGASYMVATI